MTSKNRGFCGKRRATQAQRATYLKVKRENLAQTERKVERRSIIGAWPAEMAEEEGRQCHGLCAELGGVRRTRGGPFCLLVVMIN